MSSIQAYKEIIQKFFSTPTFCRSSLSPTELHHRQNSHLTYSNHQAELFLSGQRAIWNPSWGAVAIYGAILMSGVTLPLQPFITRFLAEAGITSDQLSPNSYRVLMSLWHLWKQIGAKYPQPHKKSLTSILWDHKGFIWGFPTSNKYWKNNWFFVQGEWGETVVADPRQELARNSVPRHFYSPELWNQTPTTLTEDQAKNVVKAAQTTWEARDRCILFTEKDLLDLGLSPPISS
ncbi:hypothetical protein Dsin_002050 [Dipteronia sinensis]|uniref:Uncharacterized protein n=1 Tax=Dipteronia sinensis TaxID=43782 RepID=A0AAE0EJB4_9ROSI|nr:hypothetical protein Dsin_002050 [Dipteronia sinensis]